MKATQRLQPFGRWFVEKAVVPIVLAIIAAVGGYYVAQTQADAQQRKEDTIREMLRNLVERRAPVAYVDSSQPPSVADVTSRLMLEVDAITEPQEQPYAVLGALRVESEDEDEPEFELAEIEEEMKRRPGWVRQQVQQQQVKVWDRGWRSKK